VFVIRLPNGNLLAPESAIASAGQVMGDAYVEVGPDDPDYPRLAKLAMSEQEVQDRRRRWRDGDEALRLEFEMYLARRDQGGQDSPGDGGRPA
jgi:hypothetical protein